MANASPGAALACGLRADLAWCSSFCLGGPRGLRFQPGLDSLGLEPRCSHSRTSKYKHPLEEWQSIRKAPSSFGVTSFTS